jgi:hypothetical protein
MIATPRPLVVIGFLLRRSSPDVDDDDGFFGRCCHLVR